MIYLKHLKFNEYKRNSKFKGRLRQVETRHIAHAFDFEKIDVPKCILIFRKLKKL